LGTQEFDALNETSSKILSHASITSSALTGTETTVAILSALIQSFKNRIQDSYAIAGFGNYFGFIEISANTENT
jgi:hypothetical protein